MKKIIFIFICGFFLSCGNRESISYYPANPPMDIKIISLTEGTYTGDYLLLFRAENRNNTRFGGFLIFINSSSELVLEVMNPDDAGYKLGLAAEVSEESTIYNLGIDTQMAILFTNSSAPSDNTITVNETVYTLTTTILDKNNIVSGSWLTMRSYLWDTVNAEILQVSGPGNVVQIP